MPLTPKGKKIEHAMEHEYGEKKGKQVFYASKNKGTISGVEGKKKLMAHKMKSTYGKKEYDQEQADLLEEQTSRMDYKNKH